MKNANRLIWILAGFILFSAFAESNIPGKLRKGFEALEVHNYFSAKDLFYQSLKKDSVPAAYGLSMIYGRNDNPFFQLDSAFKFVNIAKRNYPLVDADDRADYKPYGVDSINIDKQVYMLDSLFYEIALDSNSIVRWDGFIAVHFSEPFHEDAILNRNQRAFDIAQYEKSSAAYADFLEKYPEAVQVPEARKNYDNLLFEEQTAQGGIRSYQDFIHNYPQSPYVSDAEDRVYEIATKGGKAEDYIQFIHNFPENDNVDKAWHTVYKLDIGELTAKSIAAFSMKYPDYPFMDQLRQDFEYATTRYYPVMVDSLWGFIDEKGAVRIQPKYDWVEHFSESMALVGKGNEVAFINKAGTLITDFEYDNAYAFKNGHAVVEKDGKTGVINRLGEKVIPIEYKDVGEYRDGLFYAENQDGKYGFINEDGEVIIPFLLDNATDFSDGFAVVEKNGAQGVIDKKGTLIVGFIYDWIEPFDGDNRPSRVRIGDRFGLIDHHGILIADTLYDQIGDFSDGLALAANNKNYGYLNMRGDTAIAFTYTYNSGALQNSVFFDNHARIYQKDKVGIIDTAGTKIFPAIFEDAGNFVGKLIPVKKYGKWGYANLELNLAIRYLYDSAGNFKDSLAVVSQNGKFGIIDTLGHNIIDFEYNSIEIIDSTILVSDTAFGLINLKGEEKVPMIYSSVKILDKNVLRFESAQGGGPAYYDISQQKFIWRPNL